MLTPSAHGAGDSSRIAFVAKDGPDADIFTINSDGTGLRELTNDVLAQDEPSWSPDGKKLVYVQYTGTDPQVDAVASDIYVIDADGSGARKLADAADFDYSPHWSPDGAHVAFETNGGSIFVVNADGTGLRRLARTECGLLSYPVWSPDSRTVAYHEYQGDRCNGRSDIYRIGLDGSGLRRLSGDTHANLGPFAWAPARDVVFAVGGAPGDIEVVHEDGSGLRRATSTPDADDRSPAWSPDGRRIAFDSIARPYGLDADIMLIDADGTGLRRLADVRTNDLHPAWSPDGREVAWTAYNNIRNQSSDIYVAKIDGSGVRRLTTMGTASEPAFVPGPPVPASSETTVTRSTAGTTTRPRAPARASSTTVTTTSAAVSPTVSGRGDENARSDGRNRPLAATPAGATRHHRSAWPWLAIALGAVALAAAVAFAYNRNRAPAS